MNVGAFENVYLPFSSHVSSPGYSAPLMNVGASANSHSEYANQSSIRGKNELLYAYIVLKCACLRSIADWKSSDL